MNEFEEIGLDLGDMSFDLEELFGDEGMQQEDIDLSAVPVKPILLNYNGVDYLMYTTDSVGIAQIFNKEETLDELAVSKLYLLPEGKEIKNKELLAKFEQMPEEYIKEDIINASRVEEFSNRFVRNHLLYVYKKRVY